ncbi:MAG: redoxin domain-containing protein [Opitutaceae bacterium]|jgi:bla regulator protein BlaR1|nr:redoxin domain-containing protein [Opitutaceae bacterium]
MSFHDFMHLHDFVSGLLRCSAEAATLALLVLVLQKLFHRRLAPSWRCALWLVVAARLLVPVSFSTAVSLYNLAPGAPDNTPPTTANEHTNPDPALTGIAPPLPSPPYPATATTSDPAAVATAAAASFATTNEPPPATPSVPATPATPVTSAASTGADTASRLAHWSAWIFAIWLTGVAAIFSGIWHSSHALSRRFRQASPVTAPDVLSLLDDCRLLLRIRSRITIHECDRVNSPVLHGFLRPRLLLPAGFVRRFSSDELRYVFLHELAHVKRRDLPVNWLLALLQTIHWFNPLVWFAFSRWRSEREMACDSLAIHAAGNGHNRAYGQAILRILENFVPQTLSPGLVGILENKRQLRQRIVMIAAWAPRRRVSILALSLLAGLTLVGLTDAHVPESPSATTAAPASSPAKTAPDGTVRRITFTILDAETGLPVRGAEIKARAAWLVGDDTPVTDDNGMTVSTIPLARPYKGYIASFFHYDVTHPDYTSRIISWNIPQSITADPATDVRLSLPESKTIRLSRGVTIGGVILDAQGNPLPALRYFAASSNLVSPIIRAGLMEYDSGGGFHDIAASIAGPAGEWEQEHCPSDVTDASILVRGPGGAPVMFKTEDSLAGKIPSFSVDRAALLSGQAVLTIPDGITVRGLVTDEHDQPLGNVKLKIRYAGDDGLPSHDFTTQPDGSFVLPGWQPVPVMIGAMREGFASVTTTVIPETGARASPEIHIILPPSRPLAFRVLDEAGAPLPGANVRIALSQVRALALDLKGSRSGNTTDASGRVAWNDAPVGEKLPVSIWREGYSRQTAYLSTDDIDPVVRLTRTHTNETGTPSRDLPVTLRVTDDESGQPLPGFEVWLVNNNGPSGQWPDSSEFGTNGLFKKTFTITGSPHDLEVRIVVRAPGYREWTSASFAPGTPPQEITVGMRRLSPDTIGIADPLPSTPLGLAGQQRQNLETLAENVRELLVTGDIDRFLEMAAPKSADWDSLPETAPRFREDDHAARHTIGQSARKFLEIARRAGIPPNASLRVKHVLVGGEGYIQYSITEQKPAARLPFHRNVKIVLAPGPYDTTVSASATASSPDADGDYVIDLDETLSVFPHAVRLKSGLRWNGLPPGIGDPAVREEITLARRAAKIDTWGIPPLGGIDDDALTGFGEHFAELLRRGSNHLSAFVHTVAPSDEQQGEFSRKFGEMRPFGDDHYEALTAATYVILSRIAAIGLDAGQAGIRLRQVLALQPRSRYYGSVDGMNAQKLRITLSVTTPQTTAAGKSLSGEYVLVTDRCLRDGGRWYLTGKSIHWESFPEGILPPEEAASMRAESEKEHENNPVTLPFVGRPDPKEKIAGMTFTRGPSGNRVTSVYKGGPADLAGIFAGDLLLKIDGADVTPLLPQDLTRLLASSDTFMLTLLPKKGVLKEITLTPKPQGDFMRANGGFTFSSYRIVTEVSIGDDAPDVSATSQNGSVVRLSDLKDKVVLLNFVDTTRKPSETDLPEFIRIYEAYKDKGFEIISVFLDHDPTGIDNYVKSRSIPWPINKSSWGTGAGFAYGVSGTPVSVLVVNGKIADDLVPGKILESRIRKYIK